MVGFDFIVMKMVTKIEVRFGFFEFIDFLYDFSLNEGDFIIKLCLLGIRVDFSFERFFSHFIIWFKYKIS